VAERSGGRRFPLLCWSWLGLALLLFALVVPPFWNPDEVQHFAFILDGFVSAEEHPRLECEVVALLRQTDWLRRAGEDPQGVRRLTDVATFRQLGMVGITGSGAYGTLYHRLLGAVLRPFRRAPLPRLFLLARLASLLLSLGALALLWLALAPRFPALTPLLPLLLALPQFLLLAGAVNYDVLLTLAGALFFLSALRWQVSHSPGWLVGMMAGVLGAVLTKKGGWLFLPLLGLAVLLSARWRKGLRVLLVLLAGLAAFAWLNWWFPETFQAAYRTLFASLASQAEPRMGPGQAGAFLPVLGRSLVYCFGWLWFSLPPLWYWLYGAAAGVSLAGLLTRRCDGRIICFFGFALAAQVAAIWWFYGSRGILGQGRYLFPVLVPLFYLFLEGIARPHRLMRLAPLLFVLLQVAANIIVLLTEIPAVAYLARPASPGGW